MLVQRPTRMAGMELVPPKQVQGNDPRKGKPPDATTYPLFSCRVERLLLYVEYGRNTLSLCPRLLSPNPNDKQKYVAMECLRQAGNGLC